jgi:L-ascorbate metabolism protein UlaG (beta-lactamase superfamily)
VLGVGSVLGALMLTNCAEGVATVKAVWRNTLALPNAPRPAPHHADDPGRADAKLAVLWVGQSTMLVQLGRHRVLTDPVFSEIIAGVVRRQYEPGLRAEEVPSLDATVISHLHFDHLDRPSLRALDRKTPTVLLPIGGRAWAPHGHPRRTEISAWQRWESHGLVITAVPAVHQSDRFGLDALLDVTSEHACNGYVLEADGVSVYFAGDTAFSAELFRSVHEHFPHLDLALLPIAPVEPREFMRISHLGPDEALEAFALLGARWMVPIHFDTFLNGTDQLGEPVARLHEAMSRRGLGPTQVQILEMGEQRILIPR